MTDQEMRDKSQVKIKQVLDLMKVLHLTVETRRKMDKDGFIQDLVFWIDNEKYPPEPAPVNRTLEEVMQTPHEDIPARNLSTGGTEDHA